MLQMRPSVDRQDGCKTQSMSVMQECTLRYSCREGYCLSVMRGGLESERSGRYLSGLREESEGDAGAAQIPLQSMRTRLDIEGQRKAFEMSGMPFHEMGCGEAESIHLP